MRFIVLLLLLVTYFPISLSATECGETDLICNEQCFDPFYFDCIDKSFLCPKGNQLCGNLYCFDNNIFDCFFLENRPILCEKNFILCGDACFDVLEFECLPARNGTNLLCEKHFKVCGEHCFDPNIYKCCFESELCPHIDPFCFCDV